ncbi:MAG: hypothetical protein A3D92_08170 [Bacteroidetes bacterium RIFCSPHIGHO2_02_FULL_44_7]|nr:MAG: hypothetical protein A3D92_08170 [Bacteroidetes bacterium RIFCSPHIGHO2_02_FULL_44_7]
MKRSIIQVLAPGHAYNRYKIWVAISLMIQITSTLVPSMLVQENSLLRQGFLYGTLGLALALLFITKPSWQKWLAYFAAHFGLLLCFLLLVFDLTNPGILIYLLAWSMFISLGYSREYFTMKLFFGFMLSVLLLFALGLFFAPISYYSGLERFFSIGSGTLLIALNIYLWSRRSKMNSNHFSERREAYEDIASLSGQMSAILVSRDELDLVFQRIVQESIPLLELEECMIYLKTEEEKLRPVDGGAQIAFDTETVVATCFRESEAIMISDISLSTYVSVVGNEGMKSEIAVPIFNDGEIIGVIYGGNAQRGIFRDRHFQAFNVIAAFCGIKITQYHAEKSIELIEQTKAEVDRYKELDELKNRFISNISHDLKTPLSLIKAPAKQINQLTNDPKIKALSNYVVSNADHLLRVVHQLLQLNSVENRIDALNFEQLNLHELCKGICAQYEERASSKRILFAVHTDELYFTTDAFRFEQIIHNLLGNAFRYTKEGGSVALEVSADNESVRIEVRDTGIGIAKNLEDKVFERFYKVNENNQEGTGIGLSLVREYVQMLEGEITLESEVGIGTKIRIALPLHHSQHVEEVAHKEEKFDLGLERDTKPRILIVEDHADLNEFICSYFEDEFRPIAAFNGQEAMLKLHEQLPDIIITDLMMPEKDGRTLVEEIRRDENLAHIPIIVLSAKSQVASKIDLYELGVDNFLAKPFEMEELGAVVSSTLSQRKKLRDSFRTTFLTSGYHAPGYLQVDSTVSAEEKDLPSQLKMILEERLDDSNLSVNELAQKMGYGRNRLQKELKSLTGVTPVEFIRSYRLEEARKMLSNKALSISEVAYAVGFSNLSYFTRSFKQEFGRLPSEIQNA